MSFPNHQKIKPAIPVLHLTLINTQIHPRIIRILITKKSRTVPGTTQEYTRCVLVSLHAVINLNGQKCHQKVVFLDYETTILYTLQNVPADLF